MGVYNAGGTLRETLDSILTQEEADFELIAVDDGSTDGCGALLDEYAARDRRLRVLHQDNRGLTRSLITGWAAAARRFIARQDDRDLSHSRGVTMQQSLVDEDT